MLLSKVSRSKTSLHLGGIVEGHVLKTDQIGSFLDVADHCVWYSPESVANILSFHQLEVVFVCVTRTEISTLQAVRYSQPRQL